VYIDIQRYFDCLSLTAISKLHFFKRAKALSAPSTPPMLSSPKRGGSERGSKTTNDEAEARLVSDQIDAMLEAEKASLSNHRSVVRILLLGKSFGFNPIRSKPLKYLPNHD
jgi:hypothetical protein